jgi:hypothetical protein
MKRGFWVVMSNEAGELERQFADDENHAAAVLLDMVRNLAHLAQGDRFEIIEGECEQ